MNRDNHNYYEMINSEFWEEMNINKIDESSLNVKNQNFETDENVQKEENFEIKENFENNKNFHNESNLRQQESNFAEKIIIQTNSIENNYNLDRDKILREVLPNFSDENTKNIEEILHFKNSEINMGLEHKCEDFIIPIEFSNIIKEIDSGEVSPKNYVKENNLNKMLEAAIPKKENTEKSILEIISNRIKDCGIINDNEETQINFNSGTKTIKRSYKEIKDDSFLSSKRKREITESEKKEKDEENELEKEKKIMNQIDESNLSITKNNLDSSFILPEKKISESFASSQSITPSESKNLNPIINTLMPQKAEDDVKNLNNLTHKVEIPSTPNILKISIDNDADIDSKILKKIKCIKCEVVDEQESEYDLLVCNKLSKKFKILLAINNRIPILSSKWLEDSILNKTKMPYDKYYTKDKEFEKKFNFYLFKTLNETPYATYMEEYSFYVSDHVANKDEIEELIESAGGRISENYRNNKKKKENLIIIVDKNNDRDLIKILKAKGSYNIHNVDLIINSVITQELEIEKSKYKI